MFDPNEKLASLIGSRICHDLISPIGAVANGLELLELSGLPSGPEVDLVNQSAQNAAARIKYYRLAFGDCGRLDSEHVVKTAEIVSILSDVFIGGRMSVSWHVDQDRSRLQVKAALLAIMCAEAALGTGGAIDVRMQNGSWMIEGLGKKLTLQPDLWQFLKHDMSDIFNPQIPVAPAAVQFVLLPQVLRQLGRPLSITTTDQTLILTF
ncbi:MAG: histidine phosphotransferase family protein [Pseudomonadota bacterium]